jgi:glutathione S-transferase
VKDPVARILYSATRNASSWAFRAWLGLKEAGIEFEERLVDIRVPQRFDNLARIRAFSPPGAVPVLVEGDAVIFDSLAIMEYANDLAGGRLLPADPVARAQARSLLAWQHSGLSGLCGRLSFESAFYPDRRALTSSEQAEAERVFAAWESALHSSGGPWLAGALSLADLAFVPTVVRLLAHAPGLAAWPRTATWTVRLLGRPAVEEWMREARGQPPVYLDDYRQQ